jgi:hypothetical protein
MKRHVWTGKNTMASYDIIERWVFEESADPDDESRKEVQIVREQDHGGIYIRAAYYGPSGRYGQDAPTFDISEDNQEDLIDALQEAFPRAREIRREEKIEETFNESDFDADELQKLTELAEQAGGVEELEEQLS